MVGTQQNATGLVSQRSITVAGQCRNITGLRFSCERRRAYPGRLPVNAIDTTPRHAWASAHVDALRNLHRVSALEHWRSLRNHGRRRHVVCGNYRVAAHNCRIRRRGTVGTNRARFAEWRTPRRQGLRRSIRTRLPTFASSLRVPLDPQASVLIHRERSVRRSAWGHPVLLMVAHRSATFAATISGLQGPCPATRASA